MDKQPPNSGADFDFPGEEIEAFDFPGEEIGAPAEAAPMATSKKFPYSKDNPPPDLTQDERYYRRATVGGKQYLKNRKNGVVADETGATIIDPNILKAFGREEPTKLAQRTHDAQNPDAGGWLSKAKYNSRAEAMAGAKTEFTKARADELAAWKADQKRTINGVNFVRDGWGRIVREGKKREPWAKSEAEYKAVADQFPEFKPWVPYEKRPVLEKMFGQGVGVLTKEERDAESASLREEAIGTASDAQQAEQVGALLDAQRLKDRQDIARALGEPVPVGPPRFRGTQGVPMPGPALQHAEELKAEAAEKLVKSEDPPTIAKWRDFTERSAEGFINGVVSLPRGLAETYDTARFFMGDQSAQNRNRDRLKDRNFDRNEWAIATEKTAEDVRKAFPGDKKRADEFISQLGQGTGSMLSFFVGGAAAKALKVPSKVGTMVTGAAAGGVGGLEDAQNKGASDAAKYLSFLLNAGIGTSEAIPIDRALHRINIASDGAVSRIIASGTASTLEEVIQEVGQQVGGNTVAKVLYDDKRDIFEGVDDAAKVAGVLGFLMGGGIETIKVGAEKLSAGRPSKPVAAPPNAGPPDGGNGPPPPPAADPLTVLQEAGLTPEDLATMTPEQVADAIQTLEQQGAIPKGTPAPQNLPPAAPAPGSVPMAPRTGKATPAPSLEPEAYPGEEVSAVTPVLKAGTTTAPVEVKTEQDMAGVRAVANQAPTDGQKEAGNYQHAHVNLHGLDIAIETPKGGVRKGKTKDEKPWSVTMPADYGRIKRTEGADGDQVDVYVGPNPESQQVFIIDQNDMATGKFDEHKVILGTQNAGEARRLYHQSFSDGKGNARIGAITPMSVDGLKEWLKTGDTTKELSDQVVDPNKVITGPQATVEVKAPRILPARQIADNSPTIAPETGEETQVTETATDLTGGTPAKDAPAFTSADKSYIEQFRPGSLKTNAKVFQYKEGGDESGVTGVLKDVKKWDDASAGIGIAWKDRHGQHVVANGHQRHGLATRAEAEGQKPVMTMRVYREEDGYSAHDVMIIAAKVNMGEGTGTALDAAKILKSSPTAADNLPQNAVIRDGKGLARLSDDAFGMVVNKKVNPSYAAIVGQLAPDKATHADMLGLLAKSGPDNAIEAESIVRDALEAPAVQSTMEDLFGSSQTTQILYKERAQILSDAATAIRKDRAAFTTLVKEKDRIASAGNKLVTDKNTERADEDAKLLATLQATARRKGPVADALAVAAKKLHEGQPRRQVLQGFLDSLRGKDEAPGRAGVEDSQRKPDAETKPEQKPGVAPATEKPAEIDKKDDKAKAPMSLSSPSNEDGKRDIKPSDYGSKNTLVSKSRADELRAKLKAKLSGNQLNSGIDPEVIAAGTELAVFHIEAGARKFIDMAKAIAADLGMTLEQLRPNLRSWYNGARDMMEDAGQDVSDMDSAEQVKVALKEIGNAPGSSTLLEPDRQDAEAGDTVGEADVPAQAGQTGRRPGSRRKPADDGDEGQGAASGISESDAAPVGEDGDSELLAGQSEPDGSDTAADERGGSSDSSQQGLPPERLTDDQIEDNARTAASLVERRTAQRAAGSIGVVPGDQGNIANTLPMLFPEQHGDVHKAEQRFAKPEGHGMLFTNGTGTGKAQPLNARILTPKGWRTMGNIKVGDEVIGVDGKPTVVIGVYPQGEKEIYRVRFDDGAETECCDEHLWLTQTLYERRKASANSKWNCAQPKVRSLNEIRHSINLQHFVPIVGPVEFAEQEALPVPAYTMGVLLGDGCLTTNNLTFTTMDEELADMVSADLDAGFDLKPVNVSGGRCAAYRISVAKDQKPKGKFVSHPMVDAMRAMGLMGTKSATKFVPDEYLCASLGDRLNLLQGLMDTDGYADKRSNSAFFTTVSKQLASDVVTLVRSLGGTAKTSTKVPTYRHLGVKKEGQRCYTICMHLPNGSTPFSLARKASLLSDRQSEPRRKIVGVMAVGRKPAQCIAVAHEASLYVTDDFVVTHNTYSGLGVVKRFAKQGKTNILIAAPSQGILNDWIRSAKDLGIDISTLTSTMDAGKGIVATTYANLGTNRHLADRQWDLIVADEAHKLSSDKDGSSTSALETFRALTLHPKGMHTRAQHVLRKQWDAMQAIPKAEEEARSAAYNAWKMRADVLIERWRSQPRPKALMMSATPFAYHFSLDYAEGYLFEFGTREASGYNAPSGRDAFYMENLGYRKRYGKLTKPDANVRSEIMERQLHERLKREGSLSGRALEVEKDYDRKFILVDDAVGSKIDQALDFLVEADNGKFRPISKLVEDQFDYLSRMRLLEAIKARHAIPYIKKSITMGRKVVVFHDYNHGGGFSPFDLTIDPRLDITVNVGGISQKVNVAELYEEFLARNPYVKDLDFAGFRAPIEELRAAFPDAMLYNGTVSVKTRQENKRLFNEDDNGKNLIIVQSAAGEAGISLHDVTSRHQRVLLNLGMPVRPTTSLQQEGRIYRVGQASNALFRYMSTGTNWEARGFTSRLAERAGTAENLALGNLARTIRQAFIDSFNVAEDYQPSDGEGVGGKALDRAVNETLSEFEKAKTHYWGTAAARGRRDQREGVDYFATPEPIGLKMVEFADIRPGDKVLEPSAGHGAIARYFPEDTDRTLIEPTSSLSSRAALNSPGAQVINDRFENHHITNKYNAIIMNPPFGAGGKTAMDHLAKAATHLRDGGRIVALIPAGPSADKRFEAFMESDEADSLYLTGDIQLPPVTFERAGTAVRAHIVVLQKQVLEGGPTIEQRNRDYSGAATINELFDRIENADMGQRIIAAEEVATAEADATPEPSGARFKLAQTVHGKTGEPLFVATLEEHVERDDFTALAQAARKHGGWYSNFRGQGAIPGFQFKSEAARQAFVGEQSPPEQARLSQKPLNDRDITKTPAFRKWFGDSKVVDEDGEPLVVYHGSNEEREIISPGHKEPGAWFASSLNGAANYARGDNPHIHAVYLKVTNPLVMEFSTDRAGRPFPIVDGKPLDFDNNIAIVLHAMKGGYDGVHFPSGNFSEDDSTWVAFSPTQIKSVFNRGTFDPNNPAILAAQPLPQATFYSALEVGAAQMARAGLDRDQVEADLQKLATKMLGHRIRFGMIERLPGMMSGAYDSDLRAIMVSWTQSENFIETLGHEALHALRDLGVFTHGEWELLKREARGLKLDRVPLMDRIHKAYDADYRRLMDLTEEQHQDMLAEEGVAFMMGLYVADKHPLSDRAKGIIDKLLDFIQALRNYMKGLGFTTGSRVVRDIMAGAMKNRRGTRGPGRGYYLLKRTEAQNAALAQKLPKSEAFERWFEGSKAVDAEGNPLVVYHGTGADFTSFDTEMGDGGGSHFGTKAQADLYASVEKGKILPVYLSLRNPKRMIDLGQWDDLRDERKALMAQGFDGVVYLNRREGVDVSFKDQGDWEQFASDAEFKAKYPSAQDSYIAFSPTQIKSIFNSGNFDPSNPAILAQLPIGSQDSVFTEADIAAIEATQFTNNPAFRGADGRGYRVKRDGGGFIAMRMPNKPGDPPRYFRSQDGRPWDVEQARQEVIRQIEQSKPVDMFTEENGADGKPQLVLPGAEKAPDKKLAQLKADAPLRPDKPQKGMDFGLFGDEPNQGSLFQLRMPPSRPGLRSFMEPDDSAAAIWQSTMPFMARLKGAAANIFLPVRRDLQDKMADWKRVENAIEDQTGSPLNPALRVYQTETLFAGRAEKRIEDLRMDVLEPLAEEMKAEGVDLDMLDDYLTARHAPERNQVVGARNPPNSQFHDAMTDPAIVGASGLSDNEAAQIMASLTAAGKMPALQSIVARIDTMTNNTRTTLVNGGIVDPQTVQNWVNTYQHYVPLRGDSASHEDERLPAGRGKDTRAKVAQMALGRHSRSESPTAYIIAQAKQAIVLAEKARVGRAVLRLARRFPNRNLWEVNQVVVKRRLNKSTGLVTTAADTQMMKRADNVLAVREGGNLYWVTLHHEGMSKAMTNMDAGSMHAILRSFLTLQRIFALMRTGLDPQFFIPNFIRDASTAGIHISGDQGATILKETMRDIPKAMRGVFRGQRGNLNSQWAQHYREFALAGGKVGVFGLETIDTIKSRVNRDIALLGSGPLVTPYKASRAVVRFMMDVNAAVENAVRLSLYMSMRRNGFSQDEAAFAAKEVTVNFNRSGNASKYINAGYVFFNAGVQGTARVAKALTTSKAARRVAVGLLVAGLAQDILNSMVADDGDDDGENDYDQIPEWIRERNFIVMLPWGEKGNRVQVPMPWVYNVFQYAGTNLGRVMRGKVSATEATMNVLVALANAANPLQSSSLAQTLTPTLLDPAVELFANKDWKGDPIMPEDNQFETPKPDSEKYFQSVNPFYREAAKVMNELTGGDAVRPGAIDVSPESLEYIGEFLGGGVAATANQAVQTGNALLTGGEMPAEKIPFVRKVYGTHSTTQSRNEYYTIRDAVHVTVEQLKQAAEDGDTETIKMIRRDYGADLKMDSILKETDKALGRLRKARNAASPGDRRQEIQEQMDKVMAKARKAYREFSEGAK